MTTVTFKTTVSLEPDRDLSFEEQKALLDAVIGQMIRAEIESWLEESEYSDVLREAACSVRGQQ